MSRGLADSGQATALVLVGLMVLAIPAGLAVAQGISTTADEQQTIPTVTPPSLTSPTPTETPTDTATPTSTPTPTPDGDNDTDEDTNSTEGDEDNGQTLFVNDEGGVGDGVLSQSDPSCDNSEYATIQRAVNDANQSDTVRVCTGTYVESVTVPREKTNLSITARDTVIIKGLGQPAVRSNASGVTIHGFDIRALQGADHALVIGGRNTLIVQNTITSQNGTGIYLSDGYTNQGERDPELGAATGSRIVNNTVTAFNYRIWADAGQALIRNNNVSDLKGDPDPERRTCGTNDCEGGNHSIVSSGNHTIIRNNTVTYDNHPPTLFTPIGSGILISLKETRGTSATYTRGPKRGAWHDEANNNLVVGNSVSNAPGTGFGGIGLLAGANRTVVRHNVLTGNTVGIRLFSNETVIRNNTITRLGYGIPLEGVVVEGEARITENRISLYGTGIYTRGDAVITNNTIQDNLNNGITVAYYDDYYPKVLSSALIVDNKITDNEVGIRLEGCRYCGRNASSKHFQIHRNLILNNSDLGINNHNKSYIVNATNNIWACGGPSSGADPLADPYTGRLANGSGDAISGGNGSTRNGHPMSNVHFDPFQELDSCSSAAPTPTPTPTPTPSPTQTSPPGGGGDGGAGSGGSTETEVAGGGTGNGDGDDGNSDGPGGSDDSDGGDTSTPAATSTATSTVTPTATQPPTSTLSPTPMVEPGFSIHTWLVGVAMLLGVLAIRSRSEYDGDGSND